VSFTIILFVSLTISFKTKNKRDKQISLDLKKPVLTKDKIKNRNEFLFLDINSFYSIFCFEIN
jgi:hypothetical protein